MELNINKLSDFVILYCHNLGVNISPLKLQKLLYYIQSWHITKFDKNILFDELPEAWVNGPVYRSVYNQYKDKFFRNEAINNELEESGLSEKTMQVSNSLGLSEEKVEFITAVLNVYASMSDEKLVLLTHNEEPWNNARQGLSPIARSTNKISPEIIYDYYNKRIKKKKEGANAG